MNNPENSGDKKGVCLRRTANLFLLVPLIATQFLYVSEVHRNVKARALIGVLVKRNSNMIAEGIRFGKDCCQVGFKLGAAGMSPADFERVNDRIFNSITNAGSMPEMKLEMQAAPIDTNALRTNIIEATVSRAAILRLKSPKV